MTAAFDLPGFDLDRFVEQVLAEDLGTRGDVTSAATITCSHVAAACALYPCRTPFDACGIVRESGSVVFARAAPRRRAVSSFGFGPVNLRPSSSSFFARSAIRVS